MGIYGTWVHGLYFWILCPTWIPGSTFGSCVPLVSQGVIGGHWGSLGVIVGHWGSLGVIGLFRYTLLFSLYSKCKVVYHMLGFIQLLLNIYNQMASQHTIVNQPNEHPGSLGLSVTVQCVLQRNPVGICHVNY